jgi:alkylated DNA repair dioxygenase AlkB
MESFFPKEMITLDMEDASIQYYPNFFDPKEADKIFTDLMNSTAWQQDNIVVFGKKYAQPRLTALYGNEGKSYTYSNITMHPKVWSAILLEIKKKIETIIDANFSTVLLNLYRDGNDSNGWHADNEKELGENPIIASVSFGAERYFNLKHNTIKDQKHKLILEHGSLLVMQGTTQHFWKHQIAKTTKITTPRINLTFRIIK